eukprot:TRINITY_DN329_c0_g1_i1.p1 TRINITY_DN329_c0_g1~~TRINITY_DN329_c0_g1_i1.p1  ORF type:complete len:648 (-),score=160.71 TRINITY_DN329_c0_g1_i1:119-2062(-)
MHPLLVCAAALLCVVSVLATPSTDSCSDGLFCNGIERRLANGACAAPARGPCDDGVACTEDICIEATQRCEHDASLCDEECFANCVPECGARACGEDGCGGFCGTCGAGTACLAGVCVEAVQDGTCAAPIDLVAPGTPLDGVFVVRGDTSDAVNELVPSCNTITAAPELIYRLEVPQGAAVGMAAESIGLPDSTGYEHDTVLEVRRECRQLSVGPGVNADTVACNDDSSPPGNYGSRIEALLQPGTYFLFVDGYSSAEAGPFQLTVIFTADGCVPRCAGALCGSDSCGGTCGECAEDEECVLLEGRKCRPRNCVPFCSPENECGYDGCGGRCGECNAEEASFCRFAGPANETVEAQCEVIPPCNHLTPDCGGACAADEYCGTDCVCRGVDDPLPDLIIDSDLLRDEVSVSTEFFTESSCALLEGCVYGSGWRRLLRFTVAVANQGSADHVLPAPKERADLFQYSDCHQHYHLESFGAYELLALASDEVVEVSRKQGFCAEDSFLSPRLRSPAHNCAGSFNCGEQGISAGWVDSYGSSLDCQWVDVTDVAPGTYRLCVAVNPYRVHHEVSFDNNGDCVQVTIPPLSPDDPLFREPEPQQPPQPAPAVVDIPVVPSVPFSLTFSSSSSSARVSAPVLFAVAAVVALLVV